MLFHRFFSLMTLSLSLGLLFLTQSPDGFCKTQPIGEITAIVNDNVITSAEIHQQLQFLKLRSGQSHQVMPHEQELRKKILDHMIDNTLQLDFAKKMGIEMEDSSVDEAIQNLAGQNHMTLAQFKKTIQKAGISWEYFKKQFKDELLVQQIQQQQITQKVKIDDKSIEALMKKLPKKAKQKFPATYHLRHIHVTLADNPSSEEKDIAKKKADTVLSQLQQHTPIQPDASVKTEEWKNIRIQSIPAVFEETVNQMEVGSISNPILTGNGYHIIQLIEKNQKTDTKFGTEYHLRHILLKNVSKQSYNQLMSLRKRIVGKEASFEEIAKQYSEDPHSALQGGELGWIKLDQLPSPAAKVISHLSLHEVSQPFLINDGWVLVEITNKRTIDLTQDQLRNEARQILFEQQFSKALTDWINELKKNAYIHLSSHA